MSCTYTYPIGHQIIKVFWTKSLIKVGEEHPDLSEDPEYSQRLQYLGDKQQNCTIRLSHVTQKDSHMYYFRFTTNVTTGRWVGRQGVRLTVTDLQVESPERVTEGDSVRLTCKSSCTLTDRATFIWYRNSQPLTERRDTNNELLLQSVRREDAGRYSCALHGHTSISPAVHLNVMYAPKSISVSISPSGEIVEGDSVTLSCSSDSNPPAEISWFKGGTFVGSGRIYSISKISSDHSGEYKCKSINKHGEKYSHTVTIDVMLIMSCTYTYPTGHQIMKVFWTKNPVKDVVFLDLFEDPEYSQRLQYLGDKQQNCTIRLNYVTQKDEHEYCFRFTTDVTKGRWIGTPGVSLTVTDLQVESPERVTEGDSVRLTCKSSCTLTDRATFIWYRNSQPLTERRDTNNELLLQSVRREDAGRYSCALHGHTYISPDVYLNVTYAPKSISVSISPSGEIVEGDSVTLSCSSDSNPPAEISWFKGGMFVGSGRIYSISKISSDHSGEYKCKAINKHVEKLSDTVTLNIMYAPKSISVSISPSGEIVEGDSVTLSCSSDSNPPAEISWLKEVMSVGSGRIYSISKISSDHSGEYKCKSINKHGEKDSDTVTIDVMYPPRSVSVSIIQSGQIWEGDSVTLICSSDSNPPAEIIWFKENQSSSVGSGQSFSALQSGRFYCEAHNQHGSQRSDAVTVIVKGRLVILYISTGVVCGAAAIIRMLLIWGGVAIGRFGRFPGRSAGVAMVMSVRMAPPLPLIFLLMIHRVSSADWGVSYSRSHICALKDSLVIMRCTYTYPTGHQIIKVFWSKLLIHGEEPPDLSKDPKYSQRLQYLGDKQQNCTIRLSHVTQKDSHMFYFRFTTDVTGGRWSGIPGVTLTVTDLQVESPERVTEGDSVRLTCKSSCTLTDRATFIWYRNSQPLTERRDTNNELLLQSVRREDAGRYSCALHGHTYISPTVYLNVTYAPKSVSVSIGPSAEIVEGDSVTLICSSDSNPPALNFSWFKENQSSSVGSGQSFSALQSGRFYCEAHNQHGSQRSDAVTVIIKGRLVILYISIGVICGAAAIITMLLIW
ncbi:hypothetical protein QQF64_000164 [Cirrhinus molitorella]|uniref:Ig-like domain-containing protein n=1 Tax=Cirrhinus molitorella TaxID=172907 RepID=A0ABR3NXR2_9TELE